MLINPPALRVSTCTATSGTCDASPRRALTSNRIRKHLPQRDTFSTTRMKGRRCPLTKTIRPCMPHHAPSTLGCTSHFPRGKQFRIFTPNLRVPRLTRRVIRFLIGRVSRPRLGHKTPLIFDREALRASAHSLCLPSKPSLAFPHLILTLSHLPVPRSLLPTSSRSAAWV